MTYSPVKNCRTNVLTFVFRNRLVLFTFSISASFFLDCDLVCWFFQQRESFDLFVLFIDLFYPSFGPFWSFDSVLFASSAMKSGRLIFSLFRRSIFFSSCFSIFLLYFDLDLELSSVFNPLVVFCPVCEWKPISGAHVLIIRCGSFVFFFNRLKKTLHASENVSRWVILMDNCFFELPHFCHHLMWSVLWKMERIKLGQ